MKSHDCLNSERGSESGGGTWAAPRSNNAPKPKQTAYISRSELQRIKNSTVIKQQSDIDQERADKEARKGRQHKKAQDRKERMRQKAARAKKRAQKSDVELEREAAKQVILNAAADKRDEDNDAVKLLNTLGARAAAFTVREQQLAERETRVLRERDYDIRMEKVMEIQRIKDIEKREIAEKKKRQARYADKEILCKQIEAREQVRLRKVKEVELEGEAMLRQIQKNVAAEKKRQIEKNELAKKKRVEIAQENAIQIERKKMLVQREVDADERVVEYQNMKARELAKQEADEAERKHAAEMLCAKLRSQQQKAMDNRSEMDELRAKRYQEDADRKQRARELSEEEHKAETLRLMQDAREAQLRMRQHQVEQETEAQKREYQDTIQQAWRSADREEKERNARNIAKKEHQSKLLEQIAVKTRCRAKVQVYKKREGAALKKEFQMELAKLEHTRQEIINSYKSQGIKDKYLSELTKVDVRKVQMR